MTGARTIHEVVTARLGGNGSGIVEPVAIARPWGTILRVLHNDVSAVGKRSPWSVHVLDVLPGQRLSLHRHSMRDEIFMILSGAITVQIADEHFSGAVHKWFVVPKDTFHRIEAGPGGGQVLELACGHYDQEDIQRLMDDYGRLEWRA